MDSFIAKVNAQIINPLILFLFALAVVYFLFGLFQFIANANNDEKRTIGRSHMLWGIVGLTIMMGVWFILGLILNTFNIKDINPEAGTVKLPDYIPSTPNNLNKPTR
ncbi:hypothetical protein A2917_01900 [Candidatus Nomurabacteria bacterium RIFCSPLOWO2_01_FULL_42_17]|uniref:Uncharacterized protein n=1 Tax=Candidatus Nomurabacteria bacterium RIFCSPLOWO2_01_FULL_42_17 TaxID=1801780 RepID=A0A1F6XL85_9BACT|nr:MAG: hypothetical protein A2917_01900 [Candidatus Nomurabacteria bacterium RIFCSPLOWO2_01_FULL_42_17]